MIISEYFGSGQYEGRESEVLLVGENILVNMYDEDGLYKVKKMKANQVDEAENCAEDWVLGVNQ